MDANFIRDCLRGYTTEQFCIAMFSTLIRYLDKKEIIDGTDFIKYYKDTFKDILEEVVEEMKKQGKTG